MSETTCTYCGEDFSHEIVPDNVAWEDHILFECDKPDPMLKARMNASPMEIDKVWP